MIEKKTKKLSQPYLPPCASACQLGSIRPCVQLAPAASGHNGFADSNMVQPHSYCAHDVGECRREHQKAQKKGQQVSFDLAHTRFRESSNPVYFVGVLRSMRLSSAAWWSFSRRNSNTATRPCRNPRIPPLPVRVPRIFDPTCSSPASVLLPRGVVQPFAAGRGCLPACVGENVRQTC